jgi:hypothetical protein
MLKRGKYFRYKPPIRWILKTTEKNILKSFHKTLNGAYIATKFEIQTYFVKIHTNATNSMCTRRQITRNFVSRSAYALGICSFHMNFSRWNLNLKLYDNVHF